MIRLAFVLMALCSALWGQGTAEDLFKDATAAMQKGEWSKAEFLFGELRAEAPQDPRWAQGLIGVLGARNRLQDALRLAQELMPQFETSAAQHQQLGSLFVNLNRPEEALKEFEKAIKYSESPGRTAATYSLIAQVHGRLGNMDEAIAAHHKVKEFLRQPNILLAEALMQAGKRQEAIEEFRAILRTDPNHLAALSDLARAWAADGVNLDEALEYASRAVTLAPRLFLLRDTLGLVYFKRGMLVEAEEEMIMGFELEGGNHPTLREHLGEVMDARGDWSGERRELRRLMNGELTPNQLVRMKELLRKTQEK